MNSSMASLRLRFLAIALVLAAGCSGRRDASHPTDRGMTPVDDESSTADDRGAVGGEAGETATAAVEGLDLRYVAQGGRPPVSMTLHVAPDGTAELALTSSWSRPTTPADTLGDFAAVLEPSQREALVRLVDQGDLMDQDPGEEPWSPDSTTRYLALARDGEETRITMAEALEQGQEELAALERLLVEIIGEVSRHPVRAVRASWELVPEGDGFRAAITIVHEGSQPLRVLFLDPEQPAFCMRAEAWFESEVAFPGGASAWNPVGDRVGSRTVTEQLVADGILPSGELELAPGASYRFTLPVFTPPAVEGRLQARGLLAFHRLGPGPARGLLHFDLPGLPLPTP
jgi:hypothetical protein